MTTTGGASAGPGLRDIIRGARRRWRARLLLRGLAWTAGIGLSLLLLAAVLLEALRYDPAAVVRLRWLVWGGTGLALAVLLLRPLLRRPTDARVALYLEEHEPTLNQALLTALEATEGGDVSPGLARRLVEQALAEARRVEFGRRVERGRLYRAGGALTALSVAALLVLLLGPAQLRPAFSALLQPARAASEVNPYSVAVTPGDTTIARGTDQLVTAALHGFEAADASVFTRTDPDGPFQRLSMLPDERGGFEVLLLGVDRPTEYFVESTGIRSPTYRIEVADLPYVQQLDLTYHFPAYTGLPDRSVEDGGDVAALAGTVVDVRITPTVATEGGRLLVDGVPAADLELRPDGSLVGRLTVREPGFYSVELLHTPGRLVPASPEYAIDVLADQEPSVLFRTPGRDIPASPIEEVYLEVQADDDYGVGDVRIVYSINGGPEDTVAVFRAAGAPLPSVSAGHTLFLEEWPLEPGDLVSYYALVRDNRRLGGDDAVASDMFFVSVRPFERAYREAEQQGGQPQGGGAQGAESALSELQRQIISATFNLIRQRDSYEAEDFSENVVSVALAQQRLREQVQTLLERMTNRGLTDSDPGFRDVSAILPRAAEAMDSAGARLDDEALPDAIPHEQTALRFLQQAEETFERYVTRQNQQAGGGGGQPPAADDLADLFELELDKLKNQYETVQRGERQSTDAEVDEILEQLKELARRQEQEAERQRRRAQQASQGAPGGGSAAQRDLAQEAEEAARQLQRLARATNDQQLQEAARRLQQAAESMRRGAADGGTAGAAQADAALERLEEARRRLERNRAERARREAESALRQADELARQQRDVAREVRDLAGAGAERSRRIQDLRERKDQMTQAVQGLERQLDRAAAEARADQPEAARKLQEAADGIRESKLKEKLQYSRGTIEQWDGASATTLELNIEADIQALRDRLAEAADAAEPPREDPLQEALDGTRDLVRSLESMDRRLREAGDGSGGETEGPTPGDAAGSEGGATTGEPSRGDRQAGDPAGRGRAGAADRAADPTAAGAAETGGAPPAGGPTRGNPAGLTPEEIRQYRREFGARAGQVRGLRDQLRQAGVPAEDLQAVLEAMARLERDGIYDDPAQAAALNREILDALKRLEFGLRRQVEGASEPRATLTGSDEVPSGYRKLVEEYYRRLARIRGGR